MDQNKLRKDFQRVLESRADYTIDARACESDQFSGVEFAIKGGYIPADDILDVIREHDDVVAEYIGVPPEGELARLIIFLVEPTVDTSGCATITEMRTNA